MQSKTPTDIQASYLQKNLSHQDYVYNNLHNAFTVSLLKNLTTKELTLRHEFQNLIDSIKLQKHQLKKETL